jgi:hypothetical protein
MSPGARFANGISFSDITFNRVKTPCLDALAITMRASKQTTVVRYICITLCDTLRDPEEKEAYRNKVATYVDDVFTENLDYVAGRVESQSRSLPIVTDELVNDMPFLQQIFKKEANFVHYKSQTHEHSATCIKYSYQDIRSLVDSM